MTSDNVGRGCAMRVVHVVSSNAFAGVERHALGLIRQLRTLGCQAELACPPSASRMREEAAALGIPVHPAAEGRRRAWLGALAYEIWLAPPDAIHLHDGHAAVAGALIGPLARGLVIRTQHFTRPASAVRTGWSRHASLAIHRALNSRLDGYIAVSKAAADAARNRGEIGPVVPIAVIPPGIRLPDDSVVARSQALRKTLQPPAVTFVGRLEPERRLDVLIDAIPLVRRHMPACRFVIAGSGQDERRLRARAELLGVEAAISWVGWVPEPDSVLDRSHVYVNPLAWEGFGMATAEAMACALPVVAVDSGASAEIVDHGVTGLLVAEGDPTAFAEAILYLVTDRQRAAGMGRAARNHAVERYGVDKTAQATLAFYEKLFVESSSP